MNIREKIESSPSLRIAYSSLMIAFTFISTIVISIYIPATRGFFNIGEFGVYIAALTGGPIVGLIAGGFGSALADIFLGYEYYAPITLIVKGLEGLIVGYLASKLVRIRFNRWMGITASLAVAALAITIGSAYYIGEAEVTILNISYVISLSTIIWLVVGIVMLSVTFYSTMKKPSMTAYIVAMFIGGTEMILGYFTAQYIIFGAAAFVELFYNLFQVIIGMALAITVISYIEEAIQ
ncbi:TPA: hypothetical protein EYP83_01005 [Candidatus Geothermarchaeota archaeon]|nr:hypothetical protein [Candidatus Geothermarchaeota archaeon]